MTESIPLQKIIDALLGRSPEKVPFRSWLGEKLDKEYTLFAVELDTFRGYLKDALSAPGLTPAQIIDAATRASSILVHIATEQIKWDHALTHYQRGETLVDYMVCEARGEPQMPQMPGEPDDDEDDL